MTPSSPPPRWSVQLGRAGRWLLAALGLAVGLGVALGAPGLVAIGSLGGALVAASFALAVSTAARVSEGGWAVAWPEVGPSARHLHRGERVVLEGRLVQRVVLPWRPAEISPLVSEGLAPDTEGGHLNLRSGSLWLSFSVRGAAVGDAAVTGARLSGPAGGGLFALTLDLPASVRLRVLPATYGSTRQKPFAAARVAADTSRDAVSRHRRGSGLEVRELREFAPGDPFKHIAWRATARRGRIMVREFETDARLSAWLLIDVSPSMYWGEVGLRPVDRAVELAAATAAAMLASNDRVGLMLHDHRVRLVIEPARGPQQLHQIILGLLEVHHLDHEDRTELSHAELLARIEGWFHFHDRRLFRLPAGAFQGRAPGLSEVDEAALLDACEAHLRDARLRAPPLAEPLSYQSSRVTFRRFCRLAGISLPRERETRPSGQAQGLVSALEATLSHTPRGQGGGQTIVLFSDLVTCDDAGLVRQAGLVSRRHRQQLVIVTPEREAEAAPACPGVSPRMVDILIGADRLLEARRRRQVEAWLAPAGARFISAGAKEGLARALSRLRDAS